MGSQREDNADTGGGRAQTHKQCPDHSLGLLAQTKAEDNTDFILLLFCKNQLEFLSLAPDMVIQITIPFPYLTPTSSTPLLCVRKKPLHTADIYIDRSILLLSSQWHVSVVRIHTHTPPLQVQTTGEESGKYVCF